MSNEKLVELITRFKNKEITVDEFNEEWDIVTWVNKNYEEGEGMRKVL